MRKLLSAIMLFAAATLSAGEKTPALTGVYVELTRDGQDVELFGNVDRFKLSFSANFPLAETNLMVTWSDIRGSQTFSRGNTFRLRELGDVLRFGWIVSSFDDHERKSNLTNIRLAFGNSAAGRKSSFSQGGRSFPSISRKSRVVLYPGVRTPLCTWDWGNGQKGALSLTLAITAEGLAKIRGVSRDEVILDKWLEKVGVPPDAERKSWNLRELTDYALRGEDVRLRFESGTIGMVEMLDSELGMIKILLRQPGVAASPLEARLRREYLKRLQQQLAMCKAVYEMGTIGPEPVRQKELEISEFRKRYGLPEMPPPEQKKPAQVTPPSFTDGVRTWETLISRKGCLVSAVDVKYSTEGSIFAGREWQAFFDKAKRNGVLFRFIVDKFSSERPTEIHICNFRNATEGELAVLVVQRIVNRNWYAYDGGDDELKRIAGQDAAAKVQLLKPALKNERTRAALQNYFVRAYETKTSAAAR